MSVPTGLKGKDLKNLHWVPKQTQDDEQEPVDPFCHDPLTSLSPAKTLRFLPPCSTGCCKHTWNFMDDERALTTTGFAVGLCHARSLIRRGAVAGLGVVLFSWNTYHQPKVFCPLKHYFKLVHWFFVRFLFICSILQTNCERWEYWIAQVEHVTLLVQCDWLSKPYHPVHLLSILIK